MKRMSNLNEGISVKSKYNDYAGTVAATSKFFGPTSRNYLTGLFVGNLEPDPPYNPKGDYIAIGKNGNGYDQIITSSSVLHINMGYDFSKDIIIDPNHNLGSSNQLNVPAVSLPTVDGTYTLKLTRTTGNYGVTYAYQWVKEGA